MRHLLLLVLLFVATPVFAAGPPQQPFLVIDPGMHTGVIRKIDASADGTLIATASEDKTVRLWSIPEKRLLGTFRLPRSEGEGGRAYAVALSPDGRMLAAGGLDADGELNNQGGYVYLFDTITGRMTQRLGPLPAVVYDLDFSSDGQSLAAGLEGTGGVAQWQSPFSGPMLRATAYQADVLDLEYDPDGALHVATADGQFLIYDPGLKPVAQLQLPGGDIARSIAITSDGTRLALGYRNRAGIDLISLPGFELIHHVDTGFVSRGNLGIVAWSSDGETLYASGSYFINDPDPFLILAIPDQGKGKPTVIGETMGNLLDAVTLPGAGVAYATALPSAGTLGQTSTLFGSVIANMTVKLGDNFRLRADGHAVWFGLDAGAKDPYLFDLEAMTLKPAPQAPEGFVRPDTTSLPLADWEDTAVPTLAGNPIGLRQDDVSHAAAVFPDRKSFVIGSGWDVSRFDANGGMIWQARTYGTCWGVNVSAGGELVIAAFDDGTLRWYRKSDGAELLALFIHVPTKRWIAWTPSGYYTASPGAEELIGWHVNGKSWEETPQFYPASRFRDRFYRPDVVQKILALRDEAKAVSAADAEAGRKAETGTIADLLPATVEPLLDGRSIVAKTREITIPYRLASPTGRAVTRLDVRVDGRPVATRGAAQAEAEYPLDEDLAITITVPPRASEVSLIAYIGEQPGRAATIPVTWAGAGDDGRRHNLHALLIGVSAYNNPRMKLAYAAKDAGDLAEKLKSQEGRFYEKVNVETLADGAATKSAIERQLALLKKRATPEDTVLVFFAGHGMTTAAYDFYYLAADSEMDADLLEATAVDGRLIRQILGSLPGRVVLMMDTCRSGAGIESAVDMTRTANDMAQDTAGIVMFASSQGREDSLESLDWENGAFTEALLSILDDAKVYGDDGRLSIPELEEAVTVRVSDLTEGRQNAGMTKYGAAPRFFIAGMR